ncbi:DUF5993 family protein [Flammeovirga pacifica]|uniref:DUF5993 family protein n=1 Tax=Flammeovirga pacifica TaxID=915059 RepID=UPI00373FCC17
MSIIFLCYGISFIMLIRKDIKKAYIFFVISLVASLCMFAYHTSSSLNLNF